MNPKNPFWLFASMALLLGCSNPPTTPASAQTTSSAHLYVLPVPFKALPPAPPPDFSMDLPLEPAPHRDEIKGQFCQLGKSCLALDPRPFEACLLGARHCTDKAVEPLLVEERP